MKEQVQEGSPITSPDFISREQVKDWLIENAEGIRDALDCNVIDLSGRWNTPNKIENIEVRKGIGPGALRVTISLGDCLPGLEGGKFVTYTGVNFDQVSEPGWVPTAADRFGQMEINPKGGGLVFRQNSGIATVVHQINADGRIVTTTTPRTKHA